MTSPHTVPCSSCGYDLSTMPSKAGSCPECGHRYEKARDASQRHAEISWSLLLIGGGALAYSAAFIIGSSYAYLPRANEGQGGNGHVASRYFSLIPLMVIAYGVASYGAAIQAGGFRLWCRTAIASVAVISAIIGHNSDSHWTHVQAPVWMQLNLYRGVAWWIAIVGNGCLAVLAGLLAYQLANKLRRPGLRWIALVVMASAPLVAITSLTSELVTRYLPLPQFSFGNPPAPPLPPILNDEVRTAIDVVSEIAWWFTWPLTGLLTLHLRMLLKSRESSSSIVA